jgi:hypothetical protein
MATSVSGSLEGGRWTKVAWGWGYYAVDYSASIGVPGGSYRCYSAPSPFPIGSGPLPNRLTHRVIGYGDVWLYSPMTTWFRLVPVFP